MCTETTIKNLRARIDELLKHNTKIVEENRTLRREVERLMEEKEEFIVTVTKVRR